MPELPEVETISRGLAPGLTGRHFIDALPLWSGVLKQPLAVFKQLVLNREISGTSRRAKIVRLHLAPDKDREEAVVIVHLKMTGRLFITTSPDETGAASAITPHTRLVLPMDDGNALYFQDVRKFGWCGAYSRTDLEQEPFYARLGPEPLEMTFEEFESRLYRRTGPIKPVLLNQAVVVGIGNIYADEALFGAGIHPESKTSHLTASDRKKLYSSIQDVLRRAIAAGGSTIRDYRTAEGLDGGFQNEFAVYGKKGQPCPRCAHPLDAYKLAGRTSTHCPHCQKKR
ncbi:bifunctional DNA-formamidopyrimidine glycosylase/DNA-(apurinic or apyrimidinic site) lyase [Desulfovibrio inopinatus]|uniref:bifunctional DNA-formamidopyrimidine glycosylase/DNA-(apurinic or apyrimidinic site) lyase n=1 Tax=Desulfovibrio inopinatus TaxID=102109 RepID=UPI00041B6F72|nr:bifunctional DNA-formamidopyrimidine glycosylase/DNA-(apurinic or apyrimidinic site) lyase [Desulfovibrio inopinatus]